MKTLAGRLPKPMLDYADLHRDTLRANATQEEVLEAIGVAVLMGGAPSVVYGAQALEASMQFEADGEITRRADVG